MKRSKIFIFSGLLYLFSGCDSVNSPTVSTLYRDHLATLNVKIQKYEDAVSIYYSMLDENGKRASIHSNIGIILDSLQKPEEAVKSLELAKELAEQGADASEKFAVLYNLGVHYGQAKNIELALKNYQAALKHMPNSLEIKTNIELLIQQQQEDQKKQQEQKQDQKQDSKSDSQKSDKPNEKDQKPNEKDQNKQDSKDENKDQNKEENSDQDKGDKEKDQKRKSSPKYEPRPFKGDSLSEGDVKKILGELRNQEQKIRANFEKKENGKSKSNEKDW